jgi:hypothetical protein
MAFSSERFASNDRLTLPWKMQVSEYTIAGNNAASAK